MNDSILPNLFAVTEVELTYRNKIRATDRPKITKSSDAYDLFMRVWDMNKIQLLEQFKIMLLDRGNACMGISNVATGGVSACVVDPKIVFSTALKARASGLVLAHNHPSGNLKPSIEDKALTKKFMEAGKLLDIAILDHVIVTPHSFYSMADDGLML